MLRFAFILYRLIDFYELLIVAECILSWFPKSNGMVNDLYEAVRKLTDPFVNLFRRFVGPVGGASMSIDFSPMLAIIALDIIKRFII